jgi:type IV pilus assembly protein PilW
MKTNLIAENILKGYTQRGYTQNGYTQNGYTMIELMVVTAMSLFIMMGVYTIYNTQQKTWIVQDQVAAMQQNLRSAMYYMERDIRMAGYDPTRSGNFGIEEAKPDSIKFTADMDSDYTEPGTDGDGTLQNGERIEFKTYDPDANGVLDLARVDSGGSDQIAENIERLDFIYMDADNAVINFVSGEIPAAERPNIRSVQVILTARTSRGEKGVTYTTEVKDIEGNVLDTISDDIRRRVLRAHIRCRNLGL